MCIVKAGLSQVAVPVCRVLLPKLLPVDLPAMFKQGSLLLLLWVGLDMIHDCHTRFGIELLRLDGEFQFLNAGFTYKQFALFTAGSILSDCLCQLELIDPALAIALIIPQSIGGLKLLLGLLDISDLVNKQFATHFLRIGE